MKYFISNDYFGVFLLERNLCYFAKERKLAFRLSCRRKWNLLWNYVSFLFHLSIERYFKPRVVLNSNFWSFTFRFIWKFNRYKRIYTKEDASIFDWALSHTRRSHAAEKKEKKILASILVQIRLWAISSPRLYRFRTSFVIIIEKTSDPDGSEHHKKINTVHLPICEPPICRQNPICERISAHEKSTNYYTYIIIYCTIIFLS